MTRLRPRVPAHGARGRLIRALFLLTGGILTLAVLVSYWADWSHDTELDTVDSRFAIRGDQPAPEDVVVVKIDDRTFTKLNQQWPFPRSMHGDLIKRLKDAGAKVIVYDVQFTEPSEDPDEDSALIQSVADAGNVILATTETGKGGSTRIFGGDDVLRDTGARAGHADLPNDPGGVIRRVHHSVGGLKTLSVVAAEEVRGRPVAESELGGSTAWIEYVGKTGTVRSVSFADALQGRAPRNFFRDKVVVVGSSAPSLQDIHPTSTAAEDLMSGPEIQANATVTALDGFPLDESPGGLNVALIVLLGMAGPLTVMRFPRPGAALAILVGVGVVFAVGAQLAFNNGVIVSFTYPMSALALGAVGALAVQLVVGAFERQRVRDIFARFVPEAVVDDVLERTDEGVRLGGVRREVTVMFTDVRGFTTFSETRPPDVVIDVLNQYLTAMTDVIMEHGGTLISYMGDGIMALFGAPIEQDDHADRALAASREMVGPKLEEFNRWMEGEEVGGGFRMGVGLNTGPVMVGNVGSERRLEYTAIGDVTNTASRLEGMTKGTPHSIFIADSTRAAFTQEVKDLEHVAELPVRGKQAKVSVWSVPDGREPGELVEARA